jgi:DNA modification methylase
MKKSKIDKRNKLNNLNGKDWIKSTKSYWVSEKCVDDKIALKHPAPFMVKDIIKLVSFFTKKNQIVLDPFNGTGTTLLACCRTGRKGVGIDLSKSYNELAKKRLKDQPNFKDQKIILGNALTKIKNMNDEVNYCVTSPPYHNILRNKGNGIRDVKDKYRKGARTGVEYYSENKNDLGNQKSYQKFLDLFEKIMKEVFLKLTNKSYTSIIISDFTVNKKEKNVQGDVVNLMINLGFDFVGTTILLQETKPLYPFGYPYAYVINHHHQNIINFRKNI